MILPDKYTPASDSLLGQGAQMLADRPTDESTVSETWVRFSARYPDAPFDRFLEAMSLLFMLGAVRFELGTLRWSTHEA
ncbi:ABC-three component system middle component 6 [Microbacterium sp. HMWF026]|uniref:ABC-three component system middle component 6 n=1 Tax=Microbacterium sp. HMWF026 TaxID=2056861 RepID=UPI0026B818EE